MLKCVMLKQCLFCDAIPSYIKMSYVQMNYAILISLLRYCGDAIIQPPPPPTRTWEAFLLGLKIFIKLQIYRVHLQ